MPSFGRWWVSYEWAIFRQGCRESGKWIGGHLRESALVLALSAVAGALAWDAAEWTDRLVGAVTAAATTAAIAAALLLIIGLARAPAAHALQLVDQNSALAKRLSEIEAGKPRIELRPWQEHSTAWDGILLYLKVTNHGAPAVFFGEVIELAGETSAHQLDSGQRFAAWSNQPDFRMRIPTGARGLLLLGAYSSWTDHDKTSGRWSIRQWAPRSTAFLEEQNFDVFDAETHGDLQVTYLICAEPELINGPVCVRVRFGGPTVEVTPAGDSPVRLQFHNA